MLTVSDENGTISRKYDALNRVTEYIDCNGHTVKYVYDGCGNMLTCTRPNGTVEICEYGDAGLLVSQRDVLKEGKKAAKELSIYTYIIPKACFLVVRSSS